MLEFALRGEFQKPIEVIWSATDVAAVPFQMTGAIRLTKPGAFVDFIAVDGKPLEDLAVLQNLEKFLKLIIKAGIIYKDES